MEELLPGKLRMARAEKGLTLREAAARTGVAKETLSELERGKRHPHPGTLFKVAQGYGISVRDLMEEPVLLGKAEAPAKAAPLDEGPDKQPPADLKQQVEFIVRLKEEREAEIKEVEEGIQPRYGWIFHLKAADNYLREVYGQTGHLDFVEEVRTGRVLAESSEALLCHEFSSALSELQGLTEKAQIIATEKHLNDHVVVEKFKAAMELASD